MNTFWGVSQVLRSLCSVLFILVSVIPARAIAPSASVEAGAPAELAYNWHKLSPGAPPGRSGHLALWTGTEMLVVGGTTRGNATLLHGRYNPSTDSWVALSSKGVPLYVGRSNTVWTGSELITWGMGAGARYNPKTNRWTDLPTEGAPSARGGHTAVWTGTEMIIWGGSAKSQDPNDPDGSVFFSDGARFNPKTNQWTAIRATKAIPPLSSHTAVWTGSEMIVWGGISDRNIDTQNSNYGARYHPATGRWWAIPSAPVSGRIYHTAVWTGSDMIIFGGYTNPYASDRGAIYNAAKNVWREMSITNIPTQRNDHSAVWTGKEMIVWGGRDVYNKWFYSGGRYNPATDTWTPLPNAGAPSARDSHSAVWTGSEMLVWGGNYGDDYYTQISFDDGGSYHPDTNTWTSISTGMPSPRFGHRAVWTGSEMIIWGGIGDLSSEPIRDGRRYDAESQRWLSMTTTGAPSARRDFIAVWAGTEMIVWGGKDRNGTPLNTGARYNPSQNKWRSMSTSGALAVPYDVEINFALWTGSEMIIWFSDQNTFEAYRYNPQSNTWAAVSSDGRPNIFACVGVWTGEEMIVWGSDGSGGSGGRYNPATDSWAPVSTIDGPAVRDGMSAVWTGAEMIIWGGEFSTVGARYNPATDAWTPVSTAGAPAARRDHTAVWTGTHMLIWGGTVGYQDFQNSGAYYDPLTDSWGPVSTTGSPGGRGEYTAVWTDRELIVWGGRLPDMSATRIGNGARLFPGMPTYLPGVMR